MSEGCRELRRDLTTHSHQSSTMLLEEVPRCQKQPDACWEECHGYSGILHTGFDTHQNQSENKSKGTLLLFFHDASKLPISHTAASYKLLLKMPFDWYNFFKLWSCVWLCLVYTLTWWVCSIHLQNLTTCSPAPLAMTPGQHSGMNKVAWNWSATIWKGMEDFFFKCNVELTDHLGPPCHKKSLR